MMLDSQIHPFPIRGGMAGEYRTWQIGPMMMPPWKGEKEVGWGFPLFGIFLVICPRMWMGFCIQLQRTVQDLYNYTEIFKESLLERNVIIAFYFIQYWSGSTGTNVKLLRSIYLVALYKRANTYRGKLKGLYVLLSKNQAGPDRVVKQEQEKILATTYEPFS